MADETQQPALDPNAQQPVPVTIVAGPGMPGGPVFPAEGMDTAPVPGGAYRFVSPYDGSETWKDAEGNEIKKPKGK